MGNGGKIRPSEVEPQQYIQDLVSKPSIQRVQQISLTPFLDHIDAPAVVDVPTVINPEPIINFKPRSISTGTGLVFTSAEKFPPPRQNSNSDLNSSRFKNETVKKSRIKRIADLDPLQDQEFEFDQILKENNSLSPVKPIKIQNDL